MARCCLLFLLLLVGGAWSQPVTGIVLIGPPGAGKGTQAVYLRERYHLRSLSPGEILRAEVRAGTELGKQADGYMSKGLLLPDEVILMVVKRGLEGLGPGEGFLLDGFPRTRKAAELLDALLEERRSRLAAAVQLEVPDPIVLARLTERRLCPRCQRTYHLTDHPPKEPGLCDYDQAPLVTRADDKPPVVTRRLQVYHANSDPVLDYYRDKKLLQVVDASRSIDDVRQTMTELLDARLLAPVRQRGEDPPQAPPWNRGPIHVP